MFGAHDVAPNCLPINDRNDLTPAPIAIQAHQLGKAYPGKSTPGQRLRAAFFHKKVEADAFWALRELSLEIPKGEVLGVIGRNGAGKSTLLQLLCGTVSPSAGTVHTHGRIAALLELGAGFNPDFTGRENILLNGPLLGISRELLDERLAGIIEFSGIGSFVDQPVKTYSSGMFVRLAFSLATSVDPDILIIDEALSVGDGEFSRKSFDRIIAMKERGTTILFCSHALYQVEAFCSRVMWLNEGRLMAIGQPHEVVRQYDLFLAGALVPASPLPTAAVPERLESEVGASSTAQSDSLESSSSSDAPVPAVNDLPHLASAVETATPPPTSTPGFARIRRARVGVDGVWDAKTFAVQPGESHLSIVIEFDSDPALPVPTAAITLDLPNGMVLTCAVARTDKEILVRDASGHGTARIDFPRIALRKGDYRVGVYLAHEDALHIYDSATSIVTLNVTDTHPEPGLVSLPHRWQCTAGGIDF